MATIIDRRTSKRTQSADDRDKYKQRHEETIEEYIKHKINTGTITDINNMDTLSIPISDDEPSVNANHDIMDRVFTGNKKYRKGDTIPKPDGGGSGGKAGNEDGGEDQFNFTLTREELDEYLFKNLELPYLTDKMAKELSETQFQNAGFKSNGIPSNLSVVRSFRNAIGREAAMRAMLDEQIEALEHDLELVTDQEEIFSLQEQINDLEEFRNSIPFLDDIDLRYRYKDRKLVKTTKAVMFCVMDVSGSMSKERKDIAKNFYVLLALFLRYKYKKIDIVFIAHTVEARIVNEKEFFDGRQTGGTYLSSGLQMVLDQIKEKYNPNIYNIFVAQASDAENWVEDDLKCNEIYDKLAHVINLYSFIATDITRIDSQFVERIAKISKTNSKVTYSDIKSVGKVLGKFIEIFKRD